MIFPLGVLSLVIAVDCTAGGSTESPSSDIATSMVDKTFESEDQLISRAQLALSSCNWTLGECAALWTKRYAKGRTDAAFGEMIGLSADQIYQRRRVWETFGDVHSQYTHLKWSHFYAGLNWDDAAACLGWADEMQATVAEMRAWRRAQHGEDLSISPDEELEVPFDPTGDFLTVETGVVRDPSEMGYEGAQRRAMSGAVMDDRERAATASSVAREAKDDYAPFGKGARGPAPGEEHDRVSTAPPVEQIAKRVVSTLEKCNQALNPDVLEDFSTLPIALQQRLLNVIDNLASKVAGLR